jgi:hypothetical protein
MKLLPLPISLLALFGLTTPSFAEWKPLLADDDVKVAGKLMVVRPKAGWNKSTARPSNRSERWTRDGLSLNELTFFAGVNDGETLYFMPYGAQQELPKFRSAMLPTELVELFESSNRIVLQSSVFKVESVEPARLGNYNAVRFAYSYAAQDEGLTRKGEGVAAIVGGKLYLVNFIAPAIHYFDRDIDEIRQLVSSMQLRAPQPPLPR